MRVEPDDAASRWIGPGGAIGVATALAALLLTHRGEDTAGTSVPGPGARPLTAVVTLAPGETKEEMCEGLRVPASLCALSTVRADGAVELRLEPEVVPQRVD